MRRLSTVASTEKYVPERFFEIKPQILPQNESMAPAKAGAMPIKIRISPE